MEDAEEAAVAVAAATPALTLHRWVEIVVGEQQPDKVDTCVGGRQLA